MTEPLAVVPTYLREPKDLDIVLACLDSLRRTEPLLECLVVDDGSPAGALVDEIEAASSRLQLEVVRKEENEGFSRTVNVGLRRALTEGRDAILVNADLEFIDRGWVRRMIEQPNEDGDGLASVVGALLIYPNGLIQHAGIFFSLLHRDFDHIYRYAPAELPEAQHARTCPVTGALQYIRHECLQSVGVYDEAYRMGFEDVDYCLRVFESGRACVYQPKVRAFHHESIFRGRPSPKVEDWQIRSKLLLIQKWAGTSMSRYVPSVI